MSRPSHQKWLTIVLIVLIAVNVAALVHFFFFSSSCMTDRPKDKDRHYRAGDYIRQELGLSDEQNEKMETLRRTHSDTILLTAGKMREKRNFLSMEMMKEHPDTLLLFQTCDEIGDLYAEIRKLNVIHYWKMKQICDPGQKKKLDTLFKGVFCCDDPLSGKYKKHKKHGCNTTHAGHPCANN